jgi:hypothetical protein
MCILYQKDNYLSITAKVLLFVHHVLQALTIFNTIEIYFINYYNKPQNLSLKIYWCKQIIFYISPIKENLWQKKAMLGGQFNEQFEKIEPEKLQNRSMIAIGG